MAAKSPRSLAADVLRYCAAHDYREPNKDEVNAWAALMARTPLNEEADYVQAVQNHYAEDDARKARPGDIVTEATRIRMARTGANRIPALTRQRTPMPDDVRARIRAIQGRTA